MVSAPQLQSFPEAQLRDIARMSCKSGGHVTLDGIALDDRCALGP
jgi:hypothetical protein